MFSRFPVGGSSRYVKIKLQIKPDYQSRQLLTSMKNGFYSLLITPILQALIKWIINFNPLLPTKRQSHGYDVNKSTLKENIILIS